MVISPRAKLNVDLFKKFNVMGIILLHPGPGLFIPGHTLLPQREAASGNLVANIEVASKISKLVAVEPEVLPSNLQRVNSLVRTGGFKPVGKKPGVGFLNIELVTVMGHDDIGLVEQVPHHAGEPAVVSAVGPWEVLKRVTAYSFAVQPLPGDRQQVPVIYCPEDIRLVERPSVTQDWGRFDIEKKYPRLLWLFQLIPRFA